jgi:hypothetical protein
MEINQIKTTKNLISKLDLKKVFGRKNKTPKSRKNRYTIGIAILLLILAFGLLGFSQYRDWLKNRETVADYINTNTTIYNETSQKSQQLVLSLSGLVEFDQENPDKIKEQLLQINDKSSEISNIIEQIRESKENLLPQPNVQASEVQQKFLNSLDAKEATIESLSSFLKYQTCLISSSNQQTTALDQFKINIENFTNASTATSLEDKLNFVNQAIEKINQNIKINEELPSCFTEKFENYLTNGVKNDLATDAALYKQYIAELNELSNGLRATDSLKVQATTDKLVNLAQTPPSFYSSEQFKTAIEKPTMEIRVQASALEQQESFLSKAIDDLKSKYLL